MALSIKPAWKSNSLIANSMNRHVNKYGRRENATRENGSSYDVCATGRLDVSRLICIELRKVAVGDATRFRKL